jgi:serine/threonine protein kinase
METKVSPCLVPFQLATLLILPLNVRWIMLRGRRLTYTKLQGDWDKDLEQGTVCDSGRIILTPEARIAPDDEGNPWGFKVIAKPGDEPWHLRASSEEEKRHWLTAIKNCVDISIWLQNYQIGAVLGAGAMGVVREWMNKKSGEKQAIKVIEISKLKKPENVKTEIEILERLASNTKHPNLIKCHRVYEEVNKVFLIFDLCTGGELYERIVQERFSEREASVLIRKLTSATGELHRLGILHLDIKPENIIFASPEQGGECFLTDFGLSQFWKSEEDTPMNAQECFGTPGFASPEMLSKGQYYPASDVFAIGAILYMMLVGFQPFRAKEAEEIIRKTVKGDYNLKGKDWDRISNEAKVLVDRMLEKNPKKRITIAEILEDPWIKASEKYEDSKERDKKVNSMTEEAHKEFVKMAHDEKNKQFGLAEAANNLDPMYMLGLHCKFLLTARTPPNIAVRAGNWVVDHVTRKHRTPKRWFKDLAQNLKEGRHADGNVLNVIHTRDVFFFFKRAARYEQEADWYEAAIDYAGTVFILKVCKCVLRPFFSCSCVPYVTGSF